MNKIILIKFDKKPLNCTHYIPLVVSYFKKCLVLVHMAFNYDMSFTMWLCTERNKQKIIHIGNSLPIVWTEKRPKNMACACPFCLLYTNPYIFSL